CPNHAPVVPPKSGSKAQAAGTARSPGEQQGNGSVRAAHQGPHGHFRTKAEAMNDTAQGGRRGKSRRPTAPRGRPVDPQALVDIRDLLGDRPRRRDLLIEYLHLVQDSFGILTAPHLNALAAELKMSQTEVYEVASFYHHFDIVKEGEQAPPALTVRVCDSITCEMFGARDLIADLERILGP